MDEQVGVRALWKGAKVNLPKALENLPYMPNLIHDVIKQANQQQLKLQWESQQIEALRQEMQQSNRKKRFAIVGASLLIASLLLPADWQDSVKIAIASVGGVLLLISVL